MTFSSQLTTDLAVFFNTDEFAETVIYTATGGVAASITAIVTREGEGQEPYVRGIFTATALVLVKKSEVATPRHGDIYAFDSQTWEHDPGRGVGYEDAQLHEVALRRVD